jgi:hypothetical protein
MKAAINIECETIGELTSHLYEIIRQIKKGAKVRMLNASDEFPKKISFTDDNCYGEHYVTIKPDKP